MQEDVSQDGSTVAESLPSSDSILPQWTHDIGSLTSILSLIVSLFVARKLWTISKHYRQLALVPKVKSRVRAHLRNLEKQLQFKDWVSLRSEAAAAIALAEQAKSITFGATRKSALRLITSAKSITETPTQKFQQASAERLVMELTELDAHLNHFIENQQWR